MTATAPAKETKTTTAVAKYDNTSVYTPKKLRELFTEEQGRLAAMLPQKEAAAARLAQAVVTEFSKNEALWQCTGMSLFGAALQAASLNLEIGGVLGQAYLVPYNNKEKGVKEAQFQLGYKGLIVLAHRSGQLHGSPRTVSVRKGEHFKVIQGSEPRIEHDPGNTPAAADCSDITHVYATIRYRNGGSDFEVMTKEDVEKHRHKFSKMPNSPAWVKTWEAMAWKTVLRKLLKRCPMSVGVELPPDLDAGDAPVLVAQVDEPRSLAGGSVEVDGEIVGEGGKTEVTQEDLDQVAKLVAEKEGIEFGDVEFETADIWGQQTFSQLTAEQMWKAHGILTKRMAK